MVSFKNRAPAVILGNIPNTDFYEDIDKCSDVRF